MINDSVASAVEEYDLVVLGSGEGSKYLAWTLAEPRAARRRRRAAMDRRLLPECRLPPQQEHHSQREGRVVLRPRGGVRNYDLWVYRQHGQGDGPQTNDGEGAGRHPCPQL